MKGIQYFWKSLHLYDSFNFGRLRPWDRPHSDLWISNPYINMSGFEKWFDSLLFYFRLEYFGNKKDKIYFLHFPILLQLSWSEQKCYDNDIGTIEIKIIVHQFEGELNFVRSDNQWLITWSNVIEVLLHSQWLKWS